MSCIDLTGRTVTTEAEFSTGALNRNPTGASHAENRDTSHSPNVEDTELSHKSAEAEGNALDECQEREVREEKGMVPKTIPPDEAPKNTSVSNPAKAKHYAANPMSSYSGPPHSTPTICKVGSADRVESKNGFSSTKVQPIKLGSSASDPPRAQFIEDVRIAMVHSLATKDPRRGSFFARLSEGPSRTPQNMQSAPRRNGLRRMCAGTSAQGARDDAHRAV